MPPKKNTSPMLGPRYCPSCRRVEPDDFEGSLCRGVWRISDSAGLLPGL